MGTTKTTKSETTPWAPAAPFVTGALDAQKSGYNQGAATLAQYSPAMQSALDKLSSNVTTPPSYLTAARTQLGKTINGDYIGANPYSGGIADLIAAKTQGNYNTTYGASGRSHGGMAALLSGQGVGDALNSFYSNQYNSERGNQINAINSAPAFNADEATGANALINGVNGVANQPLALANQYGQGVTQVSAPYAQNTTTQKTGGLGSVIGGALSVGGALLGGGIGTALGGGGGGVATGGAGTPSAGQYGMAGLLQGTGNPMSMGTIATGSGFNYPSAQSMMSLPKVQGLSRYLG